MRRSGFRDTDPPAVRRRPARTSLAICLWLMLAVLHRAGGPLTSVFTPIPMGGQRIRTRRGVPPTTLLVTVTPAVLAGPVAAAAIQVLVNALRAVRRVDENLNWPTVSLTTPLRGMFITAPVGAWPDTRNGTPIPVASAVHATEAAPTSAGHRLPPNKIWSRTPPAPTGGEPKINKPAEPGKSPRRRPQWPPAATFSGRSS